jgi:HAD superfamily hydrolase (TIGR01484 family)
MKSLSDFQSRNIRVVLTDIDGTLTDHGRLPAESYAALWELSKSGYKIIPVTGRPAGWCEMIARLWPVHGVVGENGAFYFSYDGNRMKRFFVRGKSQRREDRQKLKKVRAEVLEKVPGCAIASDQFARLFDLAVDFSEDVKPLAKDKVQKIVAIFEKHGAVAKVSNIHVNGWFGDYDKVSTCKTYLKKEFHMTDVKMKAECIFVGDSPNDEPMFKFFPNSFAVANIKAFLADLEFKPGYVADREEAEGFKQVAQRLNELR